MEISNELSSDVFDGASRGHSDGVFPLHAAKVPLLPQHLTKTPLENV